MHIVFLFLGMRAGDMVTSHMIQLSYSDVDSLLLRKSLEQAGFTLGGLSVCVGVRVTVHVGV